MPPILWPLLQAVKRKSRLSETQIENTKSPVDENATQIKGNTELILSQDTLDNLFFSRTKKLEEFFMQDYNLDVSHILSSSQWIEELSFSDIQEKLNKVIGDSLYPSKELDYLLCNRKTYTKLKTQWVISSGVQEVVMEFRNSKRVFNKRWMSDNVCEGLMFLILNDFLIIKEVAGNTSGRPSCRINEFDTIALERLYLQLLVFVKEYLYSDENLPPPQTDSVNLLVDKIIVSSKLLSYVNAQNARRLKKDTEQILLLLSKLLEEWDWIQTVSEIDCSRLDQYLLSDIYGVKLNKRLYDFYQDSECKNVIETKFSEKQRRLFLPMIFSFWEDIFFAKDTVPFQKLLDYMLTPNISWEKEKGIVSFLISLWKTSILRIWDEDSVFILKNDLEDIPYWDSITKDDLDFIKDIVLNNLSLSVLKSLNYQEFKKLQNIEDEETLNYVLSSKDNFDNYSFIGLLLSWLQDDLKYIPSNMKQYGQIQDILWRDKIYEKSAQELKFEIVLIYNYLLFPEMISFHKRITTWKEFADINEILTNFHSRTTQMILNDRDVLLQEIFSHPEEDIVFLSELFWKLENYDFHNFIWKTNLLLRPENREQVDVSISTDYILDRIEHCLSFKQRLFRNKEWNLANNIKSIFWEDDWKYILERFKNRNTLKNIIKVWDCLNGSAQFFSSWLREEPELAPEHIENIYSFLQFFLNFSINHFRDVSKIFTFIAKGENMDKNIVYLYKFFDSHEVKNYSLFKIAVIKYLKYNWNQDYLKNYMNDCDVGLELNERDAIIVEVLNNESPGQKRLLVKELNKLVSRIKEFWFFASSATSSTETNNSKWTGTFIKMISTYYLDYLKQNANESDQEFLSRILSINFNPHDFTSLEDARRSNALKNIHTQVISEYGEREFWFFDFLEELWRFMEEAKMWRKRWGDVTWEDASIIYKQALWKSISFFDKRINEFI